MIMFLLLLLLLLLLLQFLGSSIKTRKATAQVRGQTKDFMIIKIKPLVRFTTLHIS